MSAVDDDQRGRLRSIAACLIPGREAGLAPLELGDYDDLLDRAVAALGSDAAGLDAALAKLPARIDFAGLRDYAKTEPAAFELVTGIVTGAYYMNTEVLTSLGYPTGPRRPAPFSLAADELSSGILDPVIDRGSFVRLP